MRFSVFLVGRSTGPSHDRQVMRDLADHAVLADRLGFDAVFMPDHHFTGYAPFASDSFMFGAYLAPQLHRAHLGMSVVTLPLHHPVRFAERVNLLDQLMQGRLLIGIGSGTTPEETIGFGVNFQDSSGLMEAQVETAMALWQHTHDDAPLEFHNGPHHGTLVGRIVPEAHTRPTPRLMSVALRDASIERAARYGWPAFIPAFIPPIPASGRPSDAFVKHFDKYRDALGAAGHSQEVIDEALSWSSHTYQCCHVAETDEQAADELDEILSAYQEAIDRELRNNAKAEEISGHAVTRAPDARGDQWKRTWTISGSPTTVAEQLRHYQALGVGNIIMGFTTGPLSERRLELGNRSLRLFAEQVMPQLREPARVSADR
jgi:alkanesulfonate monooxygenase SsuD/methylene tetrahydromethanopterin reductase-like flavin-dependent oxidoreductase (luciferase family)